MTTAAEGKGLTLAFGPTLVLGGVDIAIEAGEVVALLGPSGSGKSTLLHCLAGLIRPDSGEVFLEGTRLDTQSERARSDRRLRRIGFVFQNGDLVPELTLRENVELPLWLAGAPRSTVRHRARDLLRRLDIDAVADRRAMEVSGGQHQRAAVARALAHTPAVVLADEPTGSLDTLSGEVVMDALVGAATEQGSAVLVVTHSHRIASYAAREVVLRDGQVVGSDRVVA
ncbi:MAG: ABC transporter ATP-binding protein [Tetrasphaera sp.]